MSKVLVTRLAWEDPPLGIVRFPGRPLELTAGFGSGLTRRPDDPPGIVWAVGDRGPNLKLGEAELYGWRALQAVRNLNGAKLMPRPDIGPSLARLEIGDAVVTLIEARPLIDPTGRPISGLPIPSGRHASCEPALDADGQMLDPDPAGVDTEGLAALADGRFWASEEYGPSLLLLDPSGEVLLRLVPQGVALEGAPYPVRACLPAIAARRRLNRGFEAVAASPSGERLFLAFQSPLAHPDEAAGLRARHVRIWQLDPAGRVEAQYLYPLDPPGSFRRDQAKGKLDWSDLKLCEMVALGEDRLLLLERGSETTKIYRVDLKDRLKLAAEHLDDGAEPTIEQRSALGERLPELSKRLLFTSDDHPEVSADMEGMVQLSETDLLIVSDNDFGVGEKKSAFFRLRFSQPLDQLQVELYET